MAAPARGEFLAARKAVIHLFMTGAPSHLDLFDYKPKLAEYEGKPIPPEVIGGQRYAFIRSDAAAMGPRFKFNKHGQSGAEIADVLPHLGEVVDDICLVRVDAHRSIQPRRRHRSSSTPVSPAWPSEHGLLGHVRPGGRDARVAGFCRDVDRHRHQRRRGQLVQWLSADGLRGRALPQSRATRSSTFRARPASTPRTQRETLDLVGELNRRRLDVVGDPEIDTRIASYEMAFRLQTSAPELMDLKSESQADARYVWRRSGEAVVRPGAACSRGAWSSAASASSVSINEGWDAHSDLVGNHRRTAAIPTVARRSW